MSTLLQDLRYGFRLLAKNPGFAAVSILTLALGIGLSAAMFSIVYGALLRGLPFHEADRLVALSRANPAEGSDRMGVTLHDFEAWREQQSAFESMGAFYSGTVNIRGAERAERFDGAFLTAGTLEMLGIQPQLGRSFTPEDDRPGAPPVILLSNEMWQSHYGGAPDILGRTVRANGEEMTVVGVMPEGFHFPQIETVWVPMRRSAGAERRGEGVWLEVIGRLRDGATVEQAAAQLASISRRLELEHPATNKGIQARVDSLHEDYIPREPRMLLYTMLGAVLMVLLIACANVANLLLSQAAVRIKEVGIRSALGASRRRVVTQFLTEPLAMALGGAVLGIGLAWLGVRLFNDAIADTEPPYWMRIQVDGPVLLFVLAIALFAALASGVLPALRATAGDTNEILKDESRGSSSFRIGRLSRSLVIFEIALSCGLLVAAGLMIKSVTQLRNVDFGFPTAELFTARIGLPEAAYPDSAAQVAFTGELDRRLHEVPGATAVALSTALPGMWANGSRVALQGASYAEERDLPSARRITVSPGSFEVYGMSVLEGRDFGPQDREGAHPVAIVNRAFARKHFPGGGAVGRQIRVDASLRADAPTAPWRTIVGVAPDLHVSGVENEDPEALYLPLAQDPQRFVSILARGPGDQPLALTHAVRAAVEGVDSDIPLYFVDTLAGRIAGNNWFYNVFGGIFMIMGFVALFLAAIGLYGVMAFSVSRRTREMGLRMALGAQGRDVVRLILRQGVSQLAIGLGIGVALAAGVSQLLSAALFQVEPRDPLIFSAIVAVLALTGLAASWIPAVRATRVDPNVALRCE